MNTYRVEFDSGLIAFKGTREACIAYLLGSALAEELNLVNAVSGRAESWVV